MTVPAPGGPAVSGAPPAPPWVEPTPARARWTSRAELRAGGLVVLVLAALGAVSGYLWQLWSPRTIALVTAPSQLIPDEKEAYIAADGRFVVITAAIAIVATGVVWSRRSWRGPVLAVALGVGTTAGALLTDLVGRLSGGGHTSGAINTLIAPEVQVRAGGLLVLEPLLALLLYALLTAFAARDDLGHPEPGSIEPAGDPQDLGGDGDGPGFAQQDRLTP